MLVIDSSAIIAILFDEPLGIRCATVISEARGCGLSAVNYVETGTVMADRRINPGYRSAIPAGVVVCYAVLPMKHMRGL